MENMVRQVCLVSIICSTACTLAPEGAAKKIMNICCSLVLMLIILEPLGAFDMEEYAASLARYRELEANMNLEAEQMQARLNRLVIEEELKTYIMDKAKEKGVELLDADVELRWDTGGYWVPCGASLSSNEVTEMLGYFSNVLSSELGISEENITWLNPQ